MTVTRIKAHWCVCYRVEDVSTPLVKAQVRWCSECAEEIWISDATLKVADENDMPYLCTRCLGEKMETDSQFEAVTPTSTQMNEVKTAATAHIDLWQHNRCLSCDKKLGMATGVRPGTVPEKDSVSICLYCQHIAVFDGDLKLRQPTKEELEMFEVDPQLQRALKALRMMQ